MSRELVKGITGTVSAMPEVRSNLNLASIDSIKKYADVPHGMSLIAIFMLDPLNKNVELTMKFDDESQMESFVEYVLGVWNNYEPITSFIRSYCNDGLYTTVLDNKQLSSVANHPSSNDDFKGKKVIIDIEKQTLGKEGLMYIFKFHRLNEVKPRLLKLSLKNLE